MFPKFSKSAKNAAFWDWFERNEKRFRDFAADRDDLINDLSAALRKIDRNLTFEISPSKEDIFELVLSADGIKKSFPVVHALVESAREIANWKITAFRQRMPLDDVELQFDGYTVSPQNVRYVLMAEDQNIDLLVLLPEIPDDMQQQIIGAGFILLDMALGEFDVGSNLRAIEFEGIQNIDPEIPTKPLIELPVDFDQLRAAIRDNPAMHT